MVLTQKEYLAKKTGIKSPEVSSKNTAIIQEEKKPLSQTLFVFHIGDFVPGEKKSFDYYIGDKLFKVEKNLVKCTAEYKKEFEQRGFIFIKEESNGKKD